MFKGKISKFFHTWGRLSAVTLFFVTFAAFLFWLDFFRVSEAEVSILLVGKTSTTSTDQVVENFVALSQTLSFYDRVIASNDRLDDDFVGYTKDERKKLWNETFSVKRSDESGVLVLRVKKESAETAKLLVEQSAKELFSLASFYYNVKTDIDMRVVDGPIVKTVIDHPFLYVITSVGSGVLFTLLFFSLLQALPSFFGNKKQEGNTVSPISTPASNREKAYPHFNIGDTVPLIDPKKFLPSRPTSLSYESYSQEEKQEEKRIREEILSSSTKGSAPANLPTAPSVSNLPGVAMEDLPFQFEEVIEENEEGVFEQSLLHSKPESEKKAPEPTVEEYKRRLNELLQGDK